MSSVLIKGDIWTQRRTQKEDGTKRQGAGGQSQGTSPESIFPSQSSEGNKRLTPWSWTQSLLSWQEVNFCCPKPLGPWDFAIATAVKQYIHSLFGVLGKGCPSQRLCPHLQYGERILSPQMTASSWLRSAAWGFKSERWYPPAPWRTQKTSVWSLRRN